MATLTAPITVGTASANAIHAGDLGKLVLLEGKMYRVVKANAAIAAAANKVVVRTAGTADTWTVNVTITAALCTVAGVIPPGQLGSTGTTGLISGDYFLVQVSGEATPIITTNALAIGTGITTGTTAGEGVAVSSTYAVTTHAAIYAVLLVASVTGSPTQASLRLL